MEFLKFWFQITDNSAVLNLLSLQKKWQFKHSTSSPYYSKGKAESAVKIVKSSIKKPTKYKDGTWLSILHWRNAPTVNMNSSPVQRLMSRRTRSLLPNSDKLLKPQV
ncbi:hypothetical protein AVEN_145032-1 [Araneus ventricosus]|uniref:Uncharacterized protein n=1 Tax=Araneus ventricosus TaxID=182803 RepID=A0A4Y2L8W0_ARAVE|nr:hypothetical protein AVEN_145032-1 [Araneus ventricosus]